MYLSPPYFRCVFTEKESLQQWLRDLNRTLEPQQSEAVLLGLFAATWPWLESVLARVSRGAAEVSGQSGTVGGDIVVALPRLTEQARTLLLAAATDPHGVVLKAETFEGRHIQTSGREFVELGNPRSEAVWLESLRELVRHGLIEPKGGRDEVFQVTPTGYQVAAALRAGYHPGVTGLTAG